MKRALDCCSARCITLGAANVNDRLLGVTCSREWAALYSRSEAPGESKLSANNGEGGWSDRKPEIAGFSMKELSEKTDEPFAEIVVNGLCFRDAAT